MVVQGVKMTRSCPWCIEIWMTANVAHALFTWRCLCRSNFKEPRMPRGYANRLTEEHWGGGEAAWDRGEKKGHESQVPWRQEHLRYTCWLLPGNSKTFQQFQHSKMAVPQGKLEYQSQWLIVQRNIFTKSSDWRGFFSAPSPYIKVTENTDCKNDSTEENKWWAGAKWIVNIKNHSYLRQSCLRMYALKNHSWMNT